MHEMWELNCFCPAKEIIWKICKDTSRSLKIKNQPFHKIPKVFDQEQKSLGI